ncbi:MAG: hypothetical protein ACOX88_01540 [Christensenellales bacterium]|jgi:hypothetical protein
MDEQKPRQFQLPEEPEEKSVTRGEIEKILRENIGQYAVCEFFTGTGSMVQKQGVLRSVGKCYMLLYDESDRTHVLCDIFSLKFATFHQDEQRPRTTAPTASTRLQRNQQAYRR